MDISLIEKQLEKVPPEIKNAFFSSETAEKIADIGRSNDLLLDKISDLIEETGLTMIGLKDPKDFIQNISTRLQITSTVAKKIADEINQQVLDKIKRDAREKTLSVEQRPETSLKEKISISDLEKIGNFTIEEPQKEGAEEKTESLKTMSDETVTTTHREALLDALENPQPQPQPIQPTKNDVHTEPLVDLLMNKPTSIPEEKVVKTAPSSVPTTPSKVEPVKKVAPGPDPYREAIE